MNLCIVLGPHFVRLPVNDVVRHRRGLDFSVHAHRAGFRVRVIVIVGLEVPVIPGPRQDLSVQLGKHQHFRTRLSRLGFFVGSEVGVAVLHQSLGRVVNAGPSGFTVPVYVAAVLLLVGVCVLDAVEWLLLVSLANGSASRGPAIWPQVTLLQLLYCPVGLVVGHFACMLQLDD